MNNEKSHHLIDEYCKCSSFHFKPAKSSQRTLLYQWFEQKHIKEWMHGVGLQNTLNGLEKFFQGKSDTTYWIGYDKNISFAFMDNNVGKYCLFTTLLSMNDF